MQNCGAIRELRHRDFYAKKLKNNLFVALFYAESCRETFFEARAAEMHAANFPHGMHRKCK
jgi:hypothetical protein